MSRARAELTVGLVRQEEPTGLPASYILKTSCAPSSRWTTAVPSRSAGLETHTDQDRARHGASGHVTCLCTFIHFDAMTGGCALPGTP